MFHRKCGLAGFLLPCLAGLAVLLNGCAALGERLAGDPPKRVAAVVTAYYHNSHADVLISRLLQTETLDGKGRKPSLDLVSLYTDQKPENDIGHALMAEHGVPVFETVEQALTLGTGTLAVDGVLLIAEHGKYERSETTQIQYPKRRLFEAVLAVFDTYGRVVPVFIDKHVADNWIDAKWMYDEAQRRGVPLMAGSSLPVLWRYPPVDVAGDDVVDEMVAVSYHTLDAYGFHALEMAQCLVEGRRGGETGIKRVRCLSDEAVWEAGEKGLYDDALLQAALQRLKQPRHPEKPLRERVKKPVLFAIEYVDGLRVNILTLNGAVGEWSVAWRNKDGEAHSTLFWTQEARPFMHFAYLLRGIEQMVQTGVPTWPVERTLMTSGVLDALLQSKLSGGEWLLTPQLTFPYSTEWRWQQPPPPPPDRPIRGQ